MLKDVVNIIFTAGNLNFYEQKFVTYLNNLLPSEKTLVICLFDNLQERHNFNCRQYLKILISCKAGNYCCSD